MLERRTVHIPDRSDPATLAEFPDNVARLAIATLSVPLVHDGAAIGVLTVGRDVARSYSPREIALMATFADQAAIAIENAHLFEELNDSNASLREALEQQTATAEVLRVIASSPTDLRRVLQTVVESAARLAEADTITVHQVEGNQLVCVACTDPTSLGARHDYDRGSVNGRAILETRTHHAYDPLPEHLAKYPKSRAHTFGLQAQVATPLLEPISGCAPARHDRGKKTVTSGVTERG